MQIVEFAMNLFGRPSSNIFVNMIPDSEDYNTTCMKFIAKYSKGELINVKSMTVAKKCVWTSLSRWWNAEDRRLTYDFLQTNINKSLDFTERRLLSLNVHDHQNVPEKILDLFASVRTLGNIMFTYGNEQDRAFCCELETLRTNIKHRLCVLYKHYPDVFPSDLTMVEEHIGKVPPSSQQPSVAGEEGEGPAMTPLPSSAPINIPTPIPSSSSSPIIKMPTPPSSSSSTPPTLPVGSLGSPGGKKKLAAANRKTSSRNATNNLP